MKWTGRTYEIRATNRRYATPFRDSRTGQALQLAALWLAGFGIAATVFLAFT